MPAAQNTRAEIAHNIDSSERAYTVQKISFYFRDSDLCVMQLIIKLHDALYCTGTTVFNSCYTEFTEFLCFAVLRAVHTAELIASTVPQLARAQACFCRPHKLLSWQKGVFNQKGLCHRRF